MPFKLDDYDISILKVLLKDGRKSFRQISRETGITTPTVKARFQRLVNIGLIKGVYPIIDSEKVDYANNPELRNISLDQQTNNENRTKGKKSRITNIEKNIMIKLKCDFCGGPIAGQMHVLKFGNYERFFCCTACRSDYKEKYRGRIEAIKKRHEEQEGLTDAPL
ncbi:MAG: Lrp/AsnC family leucine-responsive transcriptional regulator [Candidatus Nitrosomirales archaeon]|jgi:Lrp/AsnC family leucine-responsive transcriptional regulator